MWSISSERKPAHAAVADLFAWSGSTGTECISSSADSGDTFRLAGLKVVETRSKSYTERSKSLRADGWLVGEEGVTCVSYGEASEERVCSHEPKPGLLLLLFVAARWFGEDIVVNVVKVGGEGGRGDEGAEVPVQLLDGNGVGTRLSQSSSERKLSNGGRGTILSELSSTSWAEAVTREVSLSLVRQTSVWQGV